MEPVDELAGHDAGTNQGEPSRPVVPRPVAMVATGALLEAIYHRERVPHQPSHLDGVRQAR